MKLHFTTGDFSLGTGYVVALVPCLLSACAGSVIDPQSVGQGRYLQFLQGTTVFVETDTSNAGMMDCSNQAYQIMQQTPSFKGRTRCSFQPSNDSLPFSYRAHRQLNESDGFKPSSPYLTRTSTSQVCISMRRATAALEKTVILEDHCGAQESPRTGGPPTATVPKPPVTPQTSNSVTERLRQLEELRREKLISEREYEQKRKAIVDQL